MSARAPSANATRLRALDEAITSAALSVREAALKAGFGNVACWRAADAVVKGATHALHALDVAPTGPAAALRADERCAALHPPMPIGREDVAAVHQHMVGLRERVVAFRQTPQTPRARSAATCPIEEISS